MFTRIADISVAVIPLTSPVEAALTEGQMADVASLTNAKRRLERQGVYAIINANIHPGALLRHNPDGSPRLEAPSGSPIDIPFSLSHCRTAVAVAFGGGSAAIGVDIEDPTDRFNRVIDKYLSIQEVEALGTSPQTLLEAWTVKEAAFKAAGIPDLTLGQIAIARTGSGWRAAAGSVTINVTTFTHCDASVALAIRHQRALSEHLGDAIEGGDEAVGLVEGVVDGK